MRRLAVLSAGAAVCVLLFALCGCGDAQRDKGVVAEASEGPEVGAPTAALAQRPRILFLGTSLTAGLGLESEEAFPARVGELLEERGHPVQVVNAGVSGDTSAGGVSRLGWLLRAPPEVTLVELGANDGLRGLPPEMTEANLREIVDRAARAGARVIIAGMLMPPNYGDEYTSAFAAVFPRVARESGSILVPFLLEGVAGEADLNLPDGIHPNAEGHRRIAATLLPYVLEALPEPPTRQGEAAPPGSS